MRHFLIDLFQLFRESDAPRLVHVLMAIPGLDTILIKYPIYVPALRDGERKSRNIPPGQPSAVITAIYDVYDLHCPQMNILQ
jgi:hypothetical protein